MKATKNSKRNHQRGLTLFELLVVLAILAFLATLVAPRVVGYLGRAKTDIARTQASNIASSLELYYLDYGRYPELSDGLTALVEAPDAAERWLGPYLKEKSGLTDPWGRPFQYSVTESGDDFEVISLGRDGEEGGDGEDADIRKI
ncbi:MAG: type II secretion system major pseudopilin GspG [Alphaproteobacteria bacterium]|nr:type II secretion system major pseudopilin GspG [Alphaproteobacteria bacterium]